MPNGGHMIPGHDPRWSGTGELVYPYPAKPKRAKPKKTTRKGGPAKTARKRTRT